jgi:inorganic phosphate transporter, PiT family
MLITAILILTVIWLAWSNGGNDNFMGVATLYGSGTMSYRTALTWATITTAAGCLVSVIIAGALVASFSGRGIVPETLEGTAPLLISVAGAAAATKFLATLLGMPTSTTHALTGGLIGVGLLAGSGASALGVLGAAFLIPLALSPILAIGIVSATYPLLHRTRTTLGIDSESCVCLSAKPAWSFTTENTEGHRGMLFTTLSHPLRALRDLYGEHRTEQSASPSESRAAPTTQSAHDSQSILTFRRFDVSTFPHLHTGTTQSCNDRYTGTLCGVRAQSAVNAVHIISGGAVCFARAVNDTPKIAALLLIAGSSVVGWHLVLIAAAMVIGGLVHSRGIARTMSKRITEMNTGQGMTANVITSSLVLAASTLALPVSTTHVSCSSIFAIGLLRGRPHWRTIGSILLTWLVTLPLAIILGAVICTSITAMMQ